MEKEFHLVSTTRPIGVTEKGECTIQDTYDCNGNFVGTNVALTYQRNKKEIINFNMFFFL